MEDWIDIPKRSEAEVARERKKARELRNSAWWKNELAKGICHYCGKCKKAMAIHGGEFHQ